METIEKDDRTIIKTQIDGEVIFFTIMHPEDMIQRHHQRGRFYEIPEIECMAPHVPEGATIMDIGTNIGNHALWFAKFKAPKKIYLFEPNPIIIEVLRSNIALNKIGDVVVTDHLGIGLSDRHADGFNMKYAMKNIAGGRMLQHGGDLEVCPGDEIVGDDHIDFVKIDVERMEMEVLAGLEETMTRCRPNLFVEVDVLNLDQFEEWRAAHRYEVVETFQHTKRNINHMCLPEA